MKKLLVLLVLMAGAYSHATDLEKLGEEIYQLEQQNKSLDESIFERQKILDKLYEKRTVQSETTELDYVLNKLQDRLDYGNNTLEEEVRIIETMDTLLEISIEERQEVIDRFFKENKRK
ncbi:MULTISPECIES: hypothetical protein [unclassified Halobacteriovorax]|uniref:hypothetical protein n=1 Tax=unclassified Halobacteriovorax TaxID=2639665 RepID=UPI000EA3DFDC|nr:hypothetical protein [Halobacteriovorax sp. BALOs_7]AYF45648.1 hypothetical protein BALOs_2655 [Halobacteriovorax sp. BALOs_7]